MSRKYTALRAYPKYFCFDMNQQLKLMMAKTHVLEVRLLQSMGVSCTLREFVSRCTRRTAESNTLTFTNFTRGRQIGKQTGLDAGLTTQF
jgi:hypothetical protein